MVSHTQRALNAPIVAHGSLSHRGPKAEALEEFTRQLWMILQSQEGGYRQLHVNYSGSKSHGTGMAADVDRIVREALSMVRIKWPEEGGGRIAYQLQVSSVEGMGCDVRYINRHDRELSHKFLLEHEYPADKYWGPTYTPLCDPGLSIWAKNYGGASKTRMPQYALCKRCARMTMTAQGAGGEADE